MRAGAFGTAWHVLAPDELPPGTLPGTTPFYQFWFRGPPAGGGTFNLTDGLGVTLGP